MCTYQTILILLQFQLQDININLAIGHRLVSPLLLSRNERLNPRLSFMALTVNRVSLRFIAISICPISRNFVTAIIYNRRTLICPTTMALRSRLFVIGISRALAKSFPNHLCDITERSLYDVSLS